MVKKLMLLLFVSINIYAQDDNMNMELKNEAVGALKEFEKVWQDKLIEMVKLDSRGVKAVNYCSDNILNLTKELSSKHDGVNLRRTALRNRNHINAPDERDKQVLKGFEEVAKMGQNPDIRIITTEDSYRIYKPLVITQPICLKCHGTKTKLHPNINKFLDEKYPEDKATNFKYKHVRGAIVATFKKNTKKDK